MGRGLGERGGEGDRGKMGGAEVGVGGGVGRGGVGEAVAGGGGES